MASTKKTIKKSESSVKSTRRMLSDVARATALVPLATEKTATLASASVYAFRVAPNANRIAVRQTFREMYGILPLRVNVARVHGQERRFGRILSRQTDWKKVYITVPKGTSLDLFAAA